MIAASDAGIEDTMGDAEYERRRLEARTPSEIADTHMFVGARSHVNDHILSRLGVRRVLCVHSSCRFAENALYTTHHCALSDFGDTDVSSPEAEALAACFAQIDAAASAGERILVHCSQGINRSPTVVMAWLIVRRQWTLARAHEHVCASRTQVLLVLSTVLAFYFYLDFI
jgi:hypothetical protein